jgi:lysyl endopeptidase
MSQITIAARAAFLSFLLTGSALFALAGELPVVRGEVYVGTAKAAETPGLLTTDEELPGSWLRMGAPAKARLDALGESSLRAKRRDIGIGREVATDALEGGVNSLQWLRAGDVRIAKLRVVSAGAKALRVGLTFTGSNAVAQVRVAGSFDESRTLGPERIGGLIANSDVYWTAVTEGETQVVEIAIPADAAVPTVRVLRVSHLVAGPSDRFKRIADIGDAGACNVDLACMANPPQTLLNAAKSAVQIVFTRSAGSSALCSGTMLNDTDPATQIPYLYTGNHCFDNEFTPFKSASQMQQVASTLNTYFFFDSIACGSTAVPPFVQRTGGSVFLYNNPTQDVLLVRLNDTLPAGAFLSGYDPNTITPGTSVGVLHHPQGDLKKYSQGVVSGSQVIDPPVNASTGFWRVTYTSGTTEGGSSGAGLFVFNNGEYLLKGGLWGGEAACLGPPNTTRDNGLPDFYSRFDIAYPALAAYLAKVAPLYNVSDLWWNTSENGNGMVLIQHPSTQLVAIWYTYTPANRPLWIIMSGGTWVNGNTFTGDLFITSGNPQTAAFDAAHTSNRKVGTGTFSFSSASTGSFTWTIDGVTVTKVFQRQAF